MMPQMILENIDASYGKKTILKGVNMTIEESDRILLSGPNGSGKTTLMRIILGFLRPGKGRRSEGFERIGYVPQARNVDRQYPVTVRAFMRMAFPGIRYIFHSSVRKKRDEEINQALELAGMSAKSDKLLRECSGGELQRALIARSIVRHPGLLLLDEPTNSLDKSGKNEVMRILEKLSKTGTAVLMSTHEDNPDYLKFFSKNASIENGTLKVERQPEKKPVKKRGKK